MSSASEPSGTYCQTLLVAATITAAIDLEPEHLRLTYISKFHKQVPQTPNVHFLNDHWEFVALCFGRHFSFKLTVYN